MESDLRGGVLAMCVDMQQRVGDMTQVRIYQLCNIKV
jgi:hypothetical protein